jgi:phosphoglycolate phosphatase
MARLIEHIRAAAFDLDGTLIDTLGDLAAAVNLMLGMLGAPELPEPRVRALVGNGVEQLVLRALNESLGHNRTPPAQQSAALASFQRFYLQGLFERSRVYPGVAPALQSLADAGVTLCCITNKDSVFTVRLLAAAGLSRFFAFTLCAACAADRKPSPNMLLSACSRLGIAPAQMVYVGDSNVDITAARAAGCPVVAVSYGYGTDPAKGALEADGCIESFTELLTLSVPAPRGATYLKLCTTGAT